MSDPVLLAVAAVVGSDWADRGGPRSEFVIACRDGEVLAIAEMAPSNRWDDAARRAALGALVPLTGCGSFGYVADTTITIGGKPGDALLCLELAIIDAAAGTVGAKTHIARYTRTKKRFGNDVIDLEAFTELASPAHGELVGELATLWHLDGDRGRLGAMNVMSETGVQMSDVHPALQADLERLLAQHA
ncbi:MAG TPA: hypothetical protein VES40_08625 [Ilumatobacteraceae bacterium]|nr:hypothetical protein [Ilumatobacteraceae bacterium]